MYVTCSYNPQDDKLRIEATSRFDTETYERLKAAGYRWAPKQGCLYATWNPRAEDIALELAGEIDEDDKSREERADERAERFEKYRNNRKRDAEAAHAAVERITEFIPLGQPILVGHHSERHARRDAEKIQNGIQKAVQMWDTAEYWRYRASASLSHAERMERPDVRARRIKTLEADLRKQLRSISEAEMFTKLWMRDGLTQERALAIANRDHVSIYNAEGQYEGCLWSSLRDEKLTAEQARDKAVGIHQRVINHATRWKTHLENRLVFERAMLGSTGGLPEEKWADVKPGGRVLVGSEWCVVLRVTKKNAKPVSVTTNRRYVPKIGLEEISEYEPPTADEAAKVEKATKLPPLCNYPGAGFLHMTKAEYDKTVPKWSDFSKVVSFRATETTGRHRTRQTRKPGGSHWETVCVFLSDVKRVDPPSLAEPVTLPGPPSTLTTRVRAHRPYQPSEERQKADALRDTLKAGGVKSFVAPQLFPTPTTLADRVAELADIQPGDKVFEPEAGTGQLVKAIYRACPEAEVTTVEIDGRLHQNLTAMFPAAHHIQGDFLELNPATFASRFDVILMNPPFVNSADIKHVEHAIKFLKPNGRLVGICANGPQRHERIRPIVNRHAGTWEELPRDTFAASGTQVSSVLFSFELEGEAELTEAV